MNKHAIRAVLALAVVAIAFATVTFDPTTGVGFVGKGDVQAALGLNNAQMQAQAYSLAFTFKKTDTYAVVNAWATGNKENPVSLRYHTETVTSIVGMNAEVAYEARQRNQVTGFNLNGFKSGTVVTTGALPVVSPTVTYVTFSWDEQVWTGEWTQVSCATKSDPYKMCNGDKIFKTVTHTTDQLPAYYDATGKLVLYTEGNNKAVLGATLVSSTGGLFVNGVALPITPTI